MTSVPRDPLRSGVLNVCVRTDAPSTSPEAAFAVVGVTTVGNSFTVVVETPAVVAMVEATEFEAVVGAALESMQLLSSLFARRLKFVAAALVHPQ